MSAEGMFPGCNARARVIGAITIRFFRLRAFSGSYQKVYDFPFSVPVMNCENTLRGEIF
jgi:hypothetical protein